MELALPLLALGGMYIVSNQRQNQNLNQNLNQENLEDMEDMERKSKKESFHNMNALLPNTNIPPQNYPVENTSQLVDTVQEYVNPNAATDKYFNQNLYEQRERNNEPVSNVIQDIYSLSGNYVDSKQFKHNNMVPFNGGKVRGNTYHSNTAESVLDNMIGSGSQVLKKIEQAPLFKPEANMQWAYGAPNNSDFYQSRVNPGMYANDVKPFESIHVGPGLNKGYAMEGTGGFNSGMESRDKWLPYTVDQMRVVTNPKIEYDLANHEGPANAFIKNAATPQMLGRIEKQRPDTYFVNNQERWLTTTGAEKGEALRPIQELGIIRRPEDATDFAGPPVGTNIHAGHAPENYEKSRRPEAFTTPVNPSASVGKGSLEDRVNGHKNYNNHRSTVRQPDSFRNHFHSAVGALIAPLMDVLKPTRKDETANNVRVYGDVGSTVPQSYVVNPREAAPTTIKETTLYAPSFNINNQHDGTYVNTYRNLDVTQRNTTSATNYFSAPGNSVGDMSYSAAYQQHNNDIKSSTIQNHPNPGGMQLFNQQMHLSNLKNDDDKYGCRVNPPVSLQGLPPSTNTYGAINASQQYNESASCDRIQPSILDAFRNNPYTHSLTSSV